MDGFAEYRIQVEDAKARFCYGSSAMGSPTQRRASLSQVLETDGYLFVPASCGGGNAAKCEGWQVFSTRAGLHWLGNITGLWNGQQAVPYKDGVFYDTGDVLEINDLLNHAQSPRYVMAYAEKDGQFSFDASRSWDLNAEQYKASQDDAPGLLFRAGLAKLCAKTAELKAIQIKADKVLSVLGRELFAKSLGKVPSANIQPSAFIPVGSCPPAEKP
jgi:hypothetical protein